MGEHDQGPDVPEVQYRGTRLHEKRGRRWPIVASIAVLGSLLVGMLVLLPLYGRPGYEVGLYDANQVGPAVSVRGREVPTGASANLPDIRMVAVGRTDEGYLLYVDTHKEFAGGGGGAPERGAALATYDELWVRLGQNAYKRIELDGGQAK